MVLAILGALGGVAFFCGAIYALIKGGIKQAEAVRHLVEVVDRLDTKVDGVDTRVDNHETRITVLEDRRMRRP